MTELCSCDACSFSTLRASRMKILNASAARANLYRLIDQTNESHEPIIISGKRGRAVLISEGDWESIQEADPFQNPPPYEKLIGDLSGAYSRRITIQHRLVYEVFPKEKTVRVLRMWTHYE